MAAATKERPTKSRALGDKYKKPMGAEKIYAGTAVMINSAGFVVKAVAAAGNKGVVGVATETVDNSGGSAGDLDIEYQEGEFLFNATSIAQTAVGSVMYFTDDNTFDETQGANEPQGGKCTEYVSATSGWVRIGLALAS